MTHAHCMLDKYGYKDTLRSLLFHSENGCTNVPKLHIQDNSLTLNPLTWKIWWAPNNANKWQMGFNSEFKGLSPSEISDLSGNSSRDCNAEGEHVNRGRDIPRFCPTLQLLDVSTLLCLSSLLRSRFGKFQRNLWITLFIRILPVFFILVINQLDIKNCIFQ